VKKGRLDDALALLEKGLRVPAILWGPGIVRPGVITAIGSTLDLSMFVPGHAWHGTVSVARCLARPSRSGFDTWILGLHFEQQQDEAAIEGFRQWDAA